MPPTANEPLTATHRLQLGRLRLLLAGFTHLPLTARPAAERSIVNLTEPRSDSAKVIVMPTKTRAARTGARTAPP